MTDTGPVPPLRIDVLVAAYTLEAGEVLAGLAGQEVPEGIELVIHLGDDASPAPWGERLKAEATRYGAIYHRPAANLGRAAMRDWLVNQSETHRREGGSHPGASDLIVFLDGDSRLPDGRYIERYIEAYRAAYQEGHTPPLFALAGGTAYDQNPPPGQGRLRWAYGRRYEQRARPHRLPDGGYTGVALNNLCLTRAAYAASGGLGGLDAGYGHEDTQLGLALGRAGVTVLPIPNPVIHTGLDDDAVFIAKSVEAAVRLAGLVKAGILPAGATTLTRVGGRLAALGPIGKAIARILVRQSHGPLIHWGDGTVALQVMKVGVYVRALGEG